MEIKETLNLKEKLVKSRILWTIVTEERFVRRLYDIVENPLNNQIMSWSEDGKVIYVKDAEKLIASILPLLEEKPDFSRFYRMLENYRFIEIYYRRNEAEFVFGHSHYTRENRPPYLMKRKAEAEECCVVYVPRKILQKPNQYVTQPSQRNLERALLVQRKQAKLESKLSLLRKVKKFVQELEMHSLISSEEMD